MNYTEAAIRHYNDGELLFDDRRFDNSSQLFGFATECALKSCLRSYCFPDGRLDRKFYDHINVLWDKISIHIDPKAYPNVAQLLNSSNKPYSNWHTNHRYEFTGFVSEATCKNHKQWTGRVIGATGILGRRKVL